MNIARVYQDAPADAGLDSTDCTGVITGNDDLAASCQWQPAQHAPERAPLPGHEHQIGVLPGWRQ